MEVVFVDLQIRRIDLWQKLLLVVVQPEAVAGNRDTRKQPVEGTLPGSGLVQRVGVSTDFFEPVGTRINWQLENLTL